MKKNKILFGAIILLIIGLCFMVSCFLKNDKNQPVTADSTPLPKPNTDYVGIWADEISVTEGSENPKVQMVISRLTADKMMFSLVKIENYSSFNTAIAYRQPDGSYQFTYSEKVTPYTNKIDYIYGTQYKGKFMFSDNKMNVQIEGDEKRGIGYNGVLVFTNKFKTYETCNLLDLMTDHKSAEQIINSSELNYINLKQVYNTGLVSSVTVSLEMPFWDEQNQYEVDGISRNSFEEECIAKFGQPISTQQDSDYKEVVYNVRDKYHLTILFNQYGVIQHMECSYADEQQALGVTVQGDFKVYGTKIVEYIGGYTKNKKVKFPKGITEICKVAFSIEESTCLRQKEDMKTISVCIPKDVKIDQYAFSDIGPMNITFEKGRKLIEKNAFCGASGLFDKNEISITLPSTIKKLDTGAFENSIGLKLKLNEGLKVIGDSALIETTCNLPSTVVKIGDCALNYWHNDSEEKNVRLPNGLKEIGNHCIIPDTTSKIIIPASVKKIGECPLSYGNEASDEGFIVDKANRYYKNDKLRWLYTKDGKKLLYAVSLKGNLVVPEGVAYVGEESLNLDPNGESGPQKIILPKTLKTYNMSATSYHDPIVFQGNPPKLTGKQSSDSKDLHIIVPKGKLKAYKKAFSKWDYGKIKEQ